MKNKYNKRKKLRFQILLFNQALQKVNVIFNSTNSLELQKNKHGLGVI